jgi:hypothetical protein
VTETPVYDSFAAVDTFCTRLARVERLGPCRRLVFYSTTTVHDGTTQRQVDQLVMTAEVMQQIAAMLFQDMPDKTLDEPRRAAAH